MSRRALRDRERAQSQGAGGNDLMPPGSFATAAPPSQVPPPQPAPQQQTGPTPGYRVRDYSPDARGTQFSTVGGFTPSGADPARTVPTAPPPRPTQPPRVAAPAASMARPAVEHIAERVLTRRELRELRETTELAANPQRLVSAPAQQPAPSPAPPAAAPAAPQTPPAAAPAAPQTPPELIEPLEPRRQEFASPQAHHQLQQQLEYQQQIQYQQQQQAQYQQPAQYRQQDQYQQPPQPRFAAPAPDWNAREPEPAPDVVMVQPAAYAPPAPEFELAPDYYPAPVAQPGVPAAPSAMPPQPYASVAEVAAQGAGFARPEGHWSRQADLDARTQLDDVLPSRDLSQSDAITTSALVLPSMPANPIGALSSTGEILVTGSIELPRMLGATGVHPARFDHAEFDSIIEAGDREDSHPSSAPVRAIRAVSTHTSTQGIIAAKRPRSKVPTYLLAGVATIMGVGVVVLFVGGMLLDLF